MRERLSLVFFLDGRSGNGVPSAGVDRFPSQVWSFNNELMIQNRVDGRNVETVDPSYHMKRSRPVAAHFREHKLCSISHSRI